MLRNNSFRPFLWADKTMSSLKESKLQACENYLAGLPSFSVFDQECSVRNIEILYDYSFYAEEKHFSELHTPDSVRSIVLNHFSDEMDFLSDIEHELIVKIVLSGGHWVLRDWNDFEPAYGLVRRLWCYTSGQGEKTILHLPHQLCAAALLILANEHHCKIRETLKQIHEAIDNTIYLNGMMNANAAINHIISLPDIECIKNRQHLITRMLKVEYDYIIKPDGNMILVHSGLADPEWSSQPSERLLSEEVLSAALDSTDDLEDPLYNRLVALLEGSVRPELLPDDVADDMILLAKQNVPLVDMESALSSCLICLPTAEMRDVLRDMYHFVPRWLSLKMSRLQ